jgi:response regulator NasT
MPLPQPHYGKADEPATTLRGRRAVVVEDEGITQLQLHRILRSQGVIVVARAANGREAVAAVARHRPDFVLMDVQMPVMNGLDAAHEILRKQKVCIIMLTAFSDDEYQRAATDIGACGYVLKPITSETLVPQVLRALRKFDERRADDDAWRATFGRE